MRKFAGGIVASISLATIAAASTAQAQDYGFGYEPAPNYNWSGIYFGGALGGFLSDIDGRFLGSSTHWDAGPYGGIGGGFIGIQKEFGSFVLGIEGGYSDTFNDSGSDSCHPASACAPGHFEGQIGEIWSVGPRIGWDAGKFMPYVTGGYANADIGNTFVSGGTTVGSGSERFNGWYLGGGIDMAISGNWKIGAEYRHYEFEDLDITPRDPSGAPLPAERASVSPSADAIVARLSYVFGGDREERVPLK